MLHYLDTDQRADSGTQEFDLKNVSTALIATFLLAGLPRKANAGVVEGALIGAGIGALVGLVLSAFGDHQKTPAAGSEEKTVPADTLSLGSKFSFAIVDDSLSSQKINYAYTRIFSSYDNYTKDKQALSDTETAHLISLEFAKIGGTRAVDSAAHPDLLVQYRQILGWDMGEIVKRMTLCASRQTAEGPATPVCVQFKEETLINTHPTRSTTIAKLVGLLTSNKSKKDLNPDKFHRFRPQERPNKSDSGTPSP